MIKIINFYHTHPSSSSPHYLSFKIRFSFLRHSFFLTLFIISFPYPFPPLSFYYNHPVIHLFFLSLSYHPVSPCAHNHSSPPSSNFPTHISLSYYHSLLLLHNFFSCIPLEISIVFFSFILHLLPLSACPLFLLKS